MKRFLVFALLGPPLGFATGMFVLMPLLNAGTGGSTAYDWHQIVLLPAAYMLGIIPAVTVGLLDATLAKRGVKHRILWTTCFAFAASFIPMLPSVAMGLIQTAWIVPFGIIGAVPGAICAWIAGTIDGPYGVTSTSRHIKLPEGQAPLAPP